MRTSVTGLGFLLFFAVSQGVRDAFFGNVFQSISFLTVAIMAFAVSTVCFCLVSRIRRPNDLSRLLAAPQQFVALNVTTGLAWLGFFHGLTHLEPAIVATVYNGVGPLCALCLHLGGFSREARSPSIWEWCAYGGILMSLLALGLVVLTERSSIRAGDPEVQLVALLVLIVAGALMTISHVIARRFNDAGIGSDALMGTRFLFAIVMAVVVERYVNTASSDWGNPALPGFVVASFALITIPSFMLQLGIARASALTVNVVRSLAPVFVFAVQQFDDRLHFSAATLICVLCFSLFAISASVLRALTEIGHRSR